MVSSPDEEPQGFIRRNLFLVVLAGVLVIGLAIAFSKNSNSDESADDPRTSQTPEQPASTDDGSATSPQFDGHGADVDQSMFGDAWPLTVDSGRVNCVPVEAGNVQVVFTSDDDKRYALNGVAKAAAGDFGYLDLRSIWADDPNNPGAKIDISPLIDICSPLM